MNQKMSAGRDPKRRKTYHCHQEWEENYFLSCPNLNACASSSMPASRFLRRVGLTGKSISQPCIKGTRRIFLPKVTQEKEGERN